MFEVCLALSGLTYNAIKDWKTKEVSLIVTLVYGIVGIVSQVVRKSLGVETLLCFLPGVIALLLALATRESIGYGDAWMLLALGCVLKWKQLCMVCFLAIGLAAVAGLILCTVFRKKKEYEMPFVPFLLLSYLLVLIGEFYGY